MKLKCQIFVTLAILFLSFLMILTHFTLHTPLVVDEITIDLLILADIALRLRQEGYSKFVDNIWNWLDVATLYSIVLYWILRGPWAQIGTIEPLVLFLRYAIIVCRVGCGIREIKRGIHMKIITHAPDIESEPLVKKV